MADPRQANQQPPARKPDAPPAPAAPAPSTMTVTVRPGRSYRERGRVYAGGESVTIAAKDYPSLRHTLISADDAEAARAEQAAVIEASKDRGAEVDAGRKMYRAQFKALQDAKALAMKAEHDSLGARVASLAGTAER